MYTGHTLGMWIVCDSPIEPVAMNIIDITVALFRYLGCARVFCGTVVVHPE